MDFPSENEVWTRRLEHQHGVFQNPPVGNQVIDHENVDYRHDEIAGTGPGGVSQPQGPDII